MAYKFANFAQATLIQSIAPGDTTAYISAADAADFPTLGVGDVARCVLYTDPETFEVIDVSANVTGTLTISRAKEGTAAQAWVAGARLANTPTAALFETILATTSTTSRFTGSVTNSGNDYTLTVSGAIPLLSNGEECAFRINANGTGAIRLKVSNGASDTGFVSVKREDSTDLESGDWASGFWAVLQYDTAATAWKLVSRTSLRVLASHLSEGPLGGIRNFESNGRLDHWAAGTSIVTPASLATLADRYYCQYDGTIGAFTVSRQAFTLGQTAVTGKPKYFLRWNHSSAGSGSTLRSLRHKVPGVERFDVVEVIRSVWLKADSSLTVTAKIIQHFGTGGSPSADVEVTSTSFNLTTSWQKFTISGTPASISGKTLGSNNDDGIILALDLPLNVVMTIDMAVAQFELGDHSTKFEYTWPLDPEFGGTGHVSLANMVTALGLISSSGLLAAIQAIDGTGSGIDADLLDGSSSAAFQTVAGLLAAILAIDGSGSGIDADLLDGVQGASYLQTASLLTQMLSVDGAGSGLDADLLDGQSSAYYNPRGVQEIWIDADSIRTIGTNAAGSSTTDSGSEDVNYSTVDFDQTTQEFGHFKWAMPKSWDRGTITFIPYWTAASGTGNVVFALQAVATSNDETINVAYGTEQTSDDTLLNAGRTHIGPESSAITVAGSPAAGDLVFFRIKRNVASDNLTADAKLLGLKIKYTTDAVNDA